MSGSPYRMSNIGQLALLDVRDWLGGYPGCPVVVRRPTRMSRVVERPSRMSESVLEVLRMSGSGRDALPDVRQ